MKQSRTTIKELTAMYRAVLRYGILCNAIALGLIGGPVYAAAPNTSGTAFLFGDISVGNQTTVDNTAFGGRRMEWGYVAKDSETGLWVASDEEHGAYKYRNEFPTYNMVGRSFELSDSVAYVGPVNLTLRELTEEDHLTYNWADDGVDTDLAATAGVDFGNDAATI